MNTMYHKPDRDRDLRRKAFEHLQAEKRRGKNPSLRRIAVLTVFGGADHFYVDYTSARRAMAVYRRHRDEGTADIATETAVKARSRHISDAVDRMIKADPLMSLPDALRHVLVSVPAPRFYISVPTAMRLLRPYLRMTASYSPFPDPKA